MWWLAPIPNKKANMLMHMLYLLCMKWDITFDLFVGLCLPRATVVSWSWSMVMKCGHQRFKHYKIQFLMVHQWCLAMLVNKMFKCEQVATWFAICFLVPTVTLIKLHTNFIVRHYCRLMDGVIGVIYLCRCVMVHWMCRWWKLMIIRQTHLRCANFRQFHCISVSLLFVVYTA